VATPVKYTQVPFDSEWIDETGFMVNALDLLTPEQCDEILIGFQIVDDPSLEEATGRRRHTLRNARLMSQNTTWGQRPMMFQIGYQKVIQETRGIMDQPASARRVLFNARTVITPHQIVMKAVGSDWQHIDSPIAVKECWIPHYHRDFVTRRRWFQVGTVIDERDEWIPRFEDGFHRTCMHYLGLLFRSTGVAIHQGLSSSGNLEAVRSYFLAIERDHEACRRDIEAQIKRARSLCEHEHAQALYGQLLHAVRSSRAAFNADDLIDVLTASLRLYYEYCLETEVRLPLDAQSPIAVTNALSAA